MDNTGAFVRTERISSRRNSRPTIGLITDEIGYEYQAGIWSGVMAMAQERDANLICIVGKRLHSTTDFEKQANIIYDLVSQENVDGLVIMTAAIGSQIGSEGTRTFCERYRPLPIVSIGLKIEGCPNVLVNNEQGLREVIVHLVEHHDRRKIAFIRGPENNDEAELRFRTYWKTLADYNITVDENLVFQGNFVRSSGFDAVKTLIDKRKADFNAVVAANDQMALGFLDGIQARNIRVPYEIVVTGFDDMEEARFVNPPLTTVHQPIHEQGRHAVEILLGILSGKEMPRQVILPTRAVIRQSCGCLSQSVVCADAEKIQITKRSNAVAFNKQRDAIVSDIVQTVNESDQRAVPEKAKKLLNAFITSLHEKTSDNLLTTLDDILRCPKIEECDPAVWQEAISIIRYYALQYLERELISPAENLLNQARVMTSESAQRLQAFRRMEDEQQAASIREIGYAMMMTNNIPDLIDVAAKELPHLGIPSCCISLYEGSAAPYQQSRVMLAYCNKERLNVGTDGQIIPSQQFFPENFLDQTKRFSFVLEPLYSQDNQFGFALFEIGPRKGTIYEVLQNRISVGLQGAILKQQEQQMEATLQYERVMFRTLIDNSPDYIYAKDMEGRFIFANRSVANQLNYLTPNQLIGKSDFDLFPPELATQYRADEQIILNSDQGFYNHEGPTVDFSKKERNRWVSTNKVLLRDAEGKVIGFIGIGHDITERKNAEEALRLSGQQLRERNLELEKTIEKLNQMQIQLIQSEKLASIGQLTAGVAHEINNPLGFVASNLNRFIEYFSDLAGVIDRYNLLVSADNTDKMLKEKIKEIREHEKTLDLDFLKKDFNTLMAQTKDGVQRIKSLVDRLRGFAHLSTSGFTDIDVHTAIEDSIAMVWNELKFKAAIKKDYGSLPHIQANEGEIKQVLMNLLINSAQSIEKNGEIRIKTGMEKENIIIQIIDNGCGISPENIKKIFDPFFTTKPIGTGTGLGLWICSVIIEKHNGKITVNSEKEKGTTMTVVLPIKQKEKSS